MTSADGSKTARVTLLAERPTSDLRSTFIGSSTAPAADRPTPNSTSIPITDESCRPSRPAYLESMMAAMTAIAMMLAARAILLLTAIGAFVLTFLAVTAGTTPALIAAATYDVFVVIPCIWLYLQRG